MLRNLADVLVICLDGNLPVVAWSSKDIKKAENFRREKLLY